MTDDRVIVVGGGGAGLRAALRLAPLPVRVLCLGPPDIQAATAWAQGGMAAAVGKDDTPDLHRFDTVRAGDGLVDGQAAALVAQAAPGCVDFLLRLGVPFDRDTEGRLAVGREAAHGRARIVHVTGDGAGRAIHGALLEEARRAPHILIEEGLGCVDLRCEDGRVSAVVAARGASRQVLPARAVVLATGGVGGLYGKTTNPLASVGSGLAMAARAGAWFRDLEFVQFHPTVIDTGSDPLPLLTEALRGVGAILIDETETRFMADIPGRELASRDAVTRAVDDHMMTGHRVFLDARSAVGEGFPTRFPAAFRACQKIGLDPRTQPIPVRPAAHYHMGGIATDLRGRTSLANLWACGEVAATGLHGANRLASNSLLEALVFADRVAQDILSTEALSSSMAATDPYPGPSISRDQERIDDLRAIMSRHVGVRRDAAGLAAALDALGRIRDGSRAGTLRHDAATAALLITTAAFKRKESRGSHYRLDHPSKITAKGRSIWLDLKIAEATRETGVQSAA